MPELMNCKRCGKITSINRWDLCADCRSRKCVGCSKTVRMQREKMDRCTRCSQAQKKKLRAASQGATIFA